MIRHDEKGKRGGRDVGIPRPVRRAGAGISRGIADFDGREAKKK